MDKFCGKCGAEIDTEKGYCPCCKDVDTDICVAEKKKTGAIVLTVFISVILLVFMLLFTLKISITSDSLYDVVNDIEYSDVCNKITVYDQAGNSIAFGEHLKQYFNENMGIAIDDESLSEIVEESTFKSFISLYAYTYCDDFVNDTELFNISSIDIYYILRSNKHLIENKYNIQVTDDVLKRISEWMVDEESVEYISPRNIKNLYPSVSGAVKIILSNVTLLILALIAALLVFVLIRYYKSFARVYMGAVSIALAMLFLIAGVMLVNVFSDNIFLFIAGHFIINKLWIYALLLTTGILLVFYKQIANLLIKNR